MDANETLTRVNQLKRAGKKTEPAMLYSRLQQHFIQLHERFGRCLSERGFHSAQFTAHSDMRCGNMAVEIVDVSSGGSTCTGTGNLTLRTGWLGRGPPIEARNWSHTCLEGCVVPPSSWFISDA